MVKKVDKTKKKKPTKKKPAQKPIVIYQQKLPKQKCCTDVSKTGQAYTIPFGFADRLGTTRLTQVPAQTPAPAPVPVQTVGSPLKSVNTATMAQGSGTQVKPIKTATMGTQVIFDKPETFTVGTQMKPVKTSTMGTQVIFDKPETFTVGTQMKPVKTATMGTQVIFDKPETSSIEIQTDPIVHIGKKIKAPRKQVVLPVEEPPIQFGQEEQQTTSATEEPAPLLAASAATVESLSPMEPEPPRKLTGKEKLDIRYQNAFGKPYTGDQNIKLTNYKKMIQDKEKLNRMAKKSEKESKQK